MLSSLIGGASFADIIIQILYRIPAVIIAITLHEYAHGLVASWLGDNTARYMGRLTVNPKAHFDPIGALCMLLFGFGWANPVPINTRNFKNMRRDTALVSLAGPLMNLIIALVSIVLYSVLLGVASLTVTSYEVAKVWGIILEIIFTVFSLNISLMVFNLLPVPPLDGSKILFSFLPRKAYRFVLNYERYGSMILLILIVTDALNVPLGYLINLVAQPLINLGYSIFNLIV